MTSEIDFSKKKRNDIIPMYADLIRRCINGDDQEQMEVIDLNNKIIDRWSNSGLIYIKEKAWKIINSESK